jgi:hypothetical protein
MSLELPHFQLFAISANWRKRCAAVIIVLPASKTFQYHGAQSHVSA